MRVLYPSLCVFPLLLGMMAPLSIGAQNDAKNPISDIQTALHHLINDIEIAEVLDDQRVNDIHREIRFRVSQLRRLASSGDAQTHNAAHDLLTQYQFDVPQRIELRQKTLRANGDSPKRPLSILGAVEVLQLVNAPQKMDFGGHVDVRNGRIGHSFGLMIIRQNQDWNANKAVWNGFRTTYALKRFARYTYADRRTTPYSGVLVGFAQKNYVSNPSVTRANQIEMLWNVGTQTLWQRLGMDIHLGMGAAYNAFKSTLSNNDLTQQPAKWHLQIQGGISIGLHKKH